MMVRAEKPSRPSRWDRPKSEKDTSQGNSTNMGDSVSTAGSIGSEDIPPDTPARLPTTQIVSHEKQLPHLAEAAPSTFERATSPNNIPLAARFTDRRPRTHLRPTSVLGKRALMPDSDDSFSSRKHHHPRQFEPASLPNSSPTSGHDEARLALDDLGMGRHTFYLSDRLGDARKHINRLTALVNTHRRDLHAMNSDNVYLKSRLAVADRVMVKQDVVIKRQRRIIGAKQQKMQESGELAVEEEEGIAVTGNPNVNDEIMFEKTHSNSTPVESPVKSPTIATTSSTTAATSRPTLMFNPAASLLRVSSSLPEKLIARAISMVSEGWSAEESLDFVGDLALFGGGDGDTDEGDSVTEIGGEDNNESQEEEDEDSTNEIEVEDEE